MNIKCVVCEGIDLSFSYFVLFNVTLENDIKMNKINSNIMLGKLIHDRQIN